MSLIVLLAVLFAQLQPAHAAERRYALVVGANRGDSGELDLRWAEADARRVAEVLGRLGGVNSEDLVLLLNPDRSEFERITASLRERMAQDEERNLLYLYYSGHADAESLHLAGTHLPLASLLDRVEALPVDMRVVLLDACRAGDALARRGATPAPVFEIKFSRPTSEGMAVLTSAAEGEDAQESERLAGGVFTHHLLAGLQGAADTSGDGHISLAEVYEYTRSRTILSTTAAPVVQHPSYHFDIHGESEVVLTTLAQDRSTGILEVDQGGRYVFLRGRTKDLVAEFELPKGGALALPGGEYLVSLRLPDRVLQGAIEIVPGQRQQLDVGAMDLQPYGQTVRRGAAQRRRSVAAISLGMGASGTPAAGFEPGPMAVAGLRLDTRITTLALGFHYARHGASNTVLTTEQRSLGVHLGAFRHVELGPFSPGLGVRVGADRVHQTFTTDGSASPGTSYVGLLGPLLRVDWAFAPRWLLGLDVGADMQLYPELDPQGSETTLETMAIPHGCVQISRYI